MSRLQSSFGQVALLLAAEASTLYFPFSWTRAWHSCSHLTARGLRSGNENACAEAPRAVRQRTRAHRPPTEESDSDERLEHGDEMLDSAVRSTRNSVLRAAEGGFEKGRLNAPNARAIYCASYWTPPAPDTEVPDSASKGHSVQRTTPRNSIAGVVHGTVTRLRVISLGVNNEDRACKLSEGLDTAYSAASVELHTIVHRRPAIYASSRSGVDHRIVWIDTSPANDHSQSLASCHYCLSRHTFTNAQSPPTTKVGSHAEDGVKPPYGVTAHRLSPFRRMQRCGVRCSWCCTASALAHIWLSTTLGHLGSYRCALSVPGAQYRARSVSPWS